MISLDRQCPPQACPVKPRTAEQTALDALLLSEFEAEYVEDGPVEDDWPEEEPLPVSAFRPPVLAPDVLCLPESMAERAELHLAEIGLSDRTLNTLEEGGLHLVGELLDRRPEQLLTIPRFGPGCLDELYGALARLGFHRKSTPSAT